MPAIYSYNSIDCIGMISLCSILQFFPCEGVFLYICKGFDEWTNLISYIPQISSPYLLVGWSFGGLLAQLYTLKYKENVSGTCFYHQMKCRLKWNFSGLVLIESSSIDEAESNWDLFQEGITSFDILRYDSSISLTRIPLTINNHKYSQISE